jgi:hypothetical protein
MSNVKLNHLAKWILLEVSQSKSGEILDSSVFGDRNITTNGKILHSRNASPTAPTTNPII